MIYYKHTLQTRWIIDFGKRELFEAMHYTAAFQHIKKLVLPNVQRKADEEKATTGNEKGPRHQHLKTWWQFWRPRPELIAKQSAIPRYIAWLHSLLARNETSNFRVCRFVCSRE